MNAALRTPVKKIQEKQLNYGNKFWRHKARAYMASEGRKRVHDTSQSYASYWCHYGWVIRKREPVSSTYLELWCRTNDDGFVVQSKQAEIAFASGFSGQRGVSTWKERVRKLEALNFLISKPGVSGSLHYVQLWNPYLIIKNHIFSKQTVSWNSTIMPLSSGALKSERQT